MNFLSYGYSGRRDDMDWFDILMYVVLGLLTIGIVIVGGADVLNDIIDLINRGK